jgi:23S rRNA U2552 (ribose-2'-O)-methylase RlmE/FtsJ
MSLKIRLNKAKKTTLTQRSKELGYRGLSTYLRDLGELDAKYGLLKEKGVIQHPTQN